MRYFFYSMVASLFVSLTNIMPCSSSNRSQLIIDNKENPFCVSINTLESNENLYKIRVKINYVNDETVINNNHVLHRLFLDDDKTIMNIGKPALPVISQFIGLPIGKTFRAKINNEKWRGFNVGKIIPVQKPFTGTSKDTILTYSEKDYNDSIFNYKLLSESEVMTWKGIENVYLTICPFMYYPLKDSISVLSEFILTVNFTEKAVKRSSAVTIKEKDMHVFNNKNFLSQKHALSAKSETMPSNDDYDYLIIIGNIPEIENSQKIKDFRKWKAQKGFKTKVVSTSVIGTDSASIKNFIVQQSQYNIQYVLFVGTHEKIPIPTFISKHSQSDHLMDKSDYWYGCIDGNNDVQGDISIGRFPTNTLSDFSNMVDKTIKYESQYHNWADKLLLVSDTQIDYHQVPMQNIYNNFKDSINIHRAFASAISDGGTAATITDIINYINDGINIVTVNTHGNAGAFWLLTGNGDTLFYCDTLLLNNNTCPVFLSGACYNGDFTNDYSILKDFCRSTHSSTSFIGGSVAVYLIQWNHFIQSLYSLLFNNSFNILGDLLLASNISLLGNGNAYIDNALCTICGGDPSLELWTKGQCIFDSPDLSVSNNTIVISTTTNDYSVNIVSLEGYLLEKYNCSGNSITIPLPDTDCDITLNKHNHVPYVIHYGAQYIQNEIITGRAIYSMPPIQIGYDVTNSKEYGNVVVEPDSKVTIYNGNGGVLIKNGFECKQGANLEIK